MGEIGVLFVNEVREGVVAGVDGGGGIEVGRLSSGCRWPCPLLQPRLTRVERKSVCVSV